MNMLKKMLALTLCIAVAFSMQTSVAVAEKLDLDKEFAYFKKIKKADVSIYVKDLKSSRSYGINEEIHEKSGDAGMMAASVIKLHLAYYAVKQMEKGYYSFDRVYKDPVDGRKFTIRKEMTNMITVSSNESFNTLLRFFKPSKINKGFSDLGLESTKVYAELGPAGYGWSRDNNIKRYKTTKGGRINAYETAIMLEDVYKNKDKKFFKDLHKMMVDCSNKDRIPASVGKSTVVAHKTGTMPDSDGVFDDAGIVYGKNGSYLFVILVQHQKSSIDKKTRDAVKSSFIKLEKMNEK